MSAHFRIVHARGKQKFRVHIIAANGKKLFTSETYATRAGCLNAVDVVVNDLPLNCSVDDRTKKAKEKLP